MDENKRKIQKIIRIAKECNFKRVYPDILCFKDERAARQTGTFHMYKYFTDYHFFIVTTDCELQEEDIKNMAILAYSEKAQWTLISYRKITNKMSSFTFQTAGDTNPIIKTTTFYDKEFVDFLEDLFPPGIPG